jgi:heme exporter protein A
VSAVLALMRRDLRLALRTPGDSATVVLFFVLACVLFPLGIGPEPNILARVATGVIWVMALLASLLRLMAGLLPPAAGRLLWGDAAIADDPEAHRARLHYVGHLDALKPALTVAENLAFYAALRGAPADDMTLNRAMEAFRINRLADTPARFLSQGQRRRAALARVLAAPAPLWLLDEPTLALDDASLAQLGAVLIGHLAAGGHVIAATHAPISVKARRLALA